MRKVFNVTNLEHRKALRKNQTDEERKLWRHIRNKQLGYKFRRQHSIGSYIVDFYCPEKNLILELDGSQHMDDEIYDSERTAYLESLGITVIRFWNNEVHDSIEGVIMRLRKLLDKSHPPQSPLIRGGKGFEEM